MIPDGFERFDCDVLAPGGLVDAGARHRVVVDHAQLVPHPIFQRSSHQTASQVLHIFFALLNNILGIAQII